jgi:phenylacetate-CoA ligase
MSGGQTEKQVLLIADFHPDVIMATPSYMLNICEEFLRQGLDPRSTSLTIGIFGAEPWTEAMRSEIEERLDIDAIDLYGLSEVIGPGVACECIEAKDGAVIWEDHFLPEMLIIRGVNVFPSQIEELIVGQVHLAPQYLLEVRRDGALDHLDVLVELDPQTANVEPVREAAASDLQRRIKSYIGVTASVTICNAGTLDRSVGKARRVLDRRGESTSPPQTST